MSAFAKKPPVRGLLRLFFWKEVRPAAEMVIYLLEAGEGWRADTHRLQHANCRVSIWIANQWYGFGFRIDGREASPHDGKLMLDWFSRRALIASVKRYLGGGHGRSSQEVAELARRVTREFSAIAGRDAA